MSYSELPSSASEFLKKCISGRSDAPIEYVPVSFRKRNGQVGDRRSNAHQLHWYPAKMFYRIPIDILDALKLPRGSVVLDPFCGSGTVLVESRLRGYTAIGFDINPLSVLISRVKTTPLHGPTAATHLESICQQAKALRRIPGPDVLPHFWFRIPARNALYRLLQAIDMQSMDPPYKDFFRATLTSIVRRSSLADPNIPPLVRLRPERIETAGPRYKRAYERAMAVTNNTVYTDFASAATQNIQFVGHENADVKLPPAIVFRKSALATELANQSVDLVVTSPPYCGAQKYVRTFKLELGLLGLNQAEIGSIDHQTLGTERITRATSRKPRHLSSSQQKIIQAVRNRDSGRATVLETYLAGLEVFAEELARIMRP
ncbi:MAG: site-specific DNA-methyltransferase, partial [Rhodospirillaceae bacterium]|nr:site-specific DNA-methyltransferase [Rhodospirillaceae bacterium]